MSDNKITIENAQPGNPASEWDISGAGDPSIQGFATAISVNVGETVSFKVKTDATSYRLDIYRLGYYQGNGARKVASILPSVTLPQKQPNDPLRDPDTGLADYGNWEVSASWMADDATSGVYIAKLVRQDTGGASHIVFIVRDDEGSSDLLFQTSDTTWHAYNCWPLDSSGGCMEKSLYAPPFSSPPDPNRPNRAYKVSYNRPFATRSYWPASFLFWAEYPMIRWLEANGYDVSYFSGVDSELSGDLIRKHKIFLSVGHDEYWSGNQRRNVEAARDAGVHLAFFSGNEVFWKTRWEASLDVSGTPNRTLVCYKETLENAKIDPAPEWTGTWRDPRFSPPADGGRPENELVGAIFTVNGAVGTHGGPGADFRTLTVPGEYGRLRFSRNADIAAPFPYATIGYEWGEDLDNGFRPAGIVRLSSSTYGVPLRITDFGSDFQAGVGTHYLVLHRHNSGALVFGASTVQWAWGLDDQHDHDPESGDPAPDARMKQATVNLFADLGVQPGTLQDGLIKADPSMDTTGPDSMITSPADGATVQTGIPVTLTGTATDADGVVANVEVSVDGGATWHPATGSTNWSYVWTPRILGSAVIQSRAVDDSANLGPPSTAVTVTVEQNPGPLGLWNDSIGPWTDAYPDTKHPHVELGVKFRSDVDGFITGIRFYKGAPNTDSHTGRLWDSTGNKLAEAPFTNETPVGWQKTSFAAPVPIVANTTYIASYNTSAGSGVSVNYYAVNRYYFGEEIVCAPLRAPASSPTDGNGVFSTDAGGFPNTTDQDTNYWVDVIFRTAVG